ncbi:MAG: L-lactate permease [Oscillospiraceae bacterium]|nr:L-lactate permease [Oscillospiraceae bacterium]
MNIPTDVPHWFMAFLPILVLLVLMIKFRWRATEAAPLGLFTALLSAVVVFRANAQLLAVESAKGIWSALMVLMVIWPAILMYEISGEARAFSTFRAGIRRLIPNELLQVLAIGLGFVGFLIGITGFGVPVAVGAPLLAGIGVTPLYAVIISLIGEAWGSTFGTLAVAWDALRLSTGLDSDPALLLRTAMWAGIFIWLWNFIIGLVICWFYGRMKGIRKGLPAVLLISLVQGGGQLLMGQLNQTIACFLPTCIALVVIFLLGRTRLYRVPWRCEESPIMDRSAPQSEAEDGGGMTMLQAFLPYIALTVLTLTVLLIAPVKSFLGQWSFGFSLPETSTGYGYVNPAVAAYSPISPLTHASLFLLLSSFFALAFYMKRGWIKKERVGGIFLRSVSKTVPSGFAVIGFLIMSRIMSGSGQTAVLAAGMAAVLGKGYALLAPAVGLLGAFMTSSNMASNILFSEFQLTTAQLLGLDAAKVLGAQTAGGAIGAATCPGNIILGTTTANILGREGDVLKKTLPVSMAAAALTGVILFAVLVLI